jgi:outer membrane lipoprotein SlyB|tara:strand:- start:44 stop:535 length:492 start_codon:yes stop_codon:yes gene_type:complete
MDTKTKSISGALAALLLIFISGCASGGYETVPNSSAGTTQSIDLGTVVATRTVKIEGESSQLGLYGGGVMGSAIGSTIGGGDGRVLASAGGAVVGAIVGKKIEKALTTKLAQEMTIELDDGRTVVVVQELKDPEFYSGDRVSVLQTRNGDARVRHEDYTTAQY